MGVLLQAGVWPRVFRARGCWGGWGREACGQSWTGEWPLLSRQAPKPGCPERSGGCGWGAPGWGGRGQEGLGTQGRPSHCPRLSPGAQVLFNVAAAQCRLGLWAEATRSLEEAVAKGPEGACDLNTALGHVQVRKAGEEGRQGARGERVPLRLPSGLRWGYGPAAHSVGLTCAQVPQTNDLIGSSFWRVVAHVLRCGGWQVLPTACGK